MPVNSLYQNDYNIWHKSFLGGGKGGEGSEWEKGASEIFYIQNILYSKL